MFRDRLAPDELAKVLRDHGLTPHDVLSVRSRPYRDLGLEERQVSDEELLALMSEHPALIRRPLVVAGSGAVVGFNRDSLAALVRDQEQDQR